MVTCVHDDVCLWSPVFMTTFVIVFISYSCCHEASRLDGQWLSDHTINFVRWQTGSTLQWSMGEACCAWCIVFVL